jgi:hypothetical protein
MLNSNSLVVLFNIKTRAQNRKNVAHIKIAASELMVMKIISILKYPTS